jgi:hypothetical protein
MSTNDNQPGMEKSGTVLLTQHDLDEFHQGRVTDRVKDTWNFTLEQLKKVVENNDFTKN